MRRALRIIAAARTPLPRCNGLRFAGEGFFNGIGHSATSYVALENVCSFGVTSDVWQRSFSLRIFLSSITLLPSKRD